MLSMSEVPVAQLLHVVLSSSLPAAHHWMLMILLAVLYLFWALPSVRLAQMLKNKKQQTKKPTPNPKIA